MFTMNGVVKVGVIIAGVTLGWSTGANAQASAPVTAQAHAVAAQQQADAARQRASELARAGGWAYKSGLVAQAERDAVRYQEEADREVAEAQPCPPPVTPSPAQAAALARLEVLRQAGGWAYKTGAVARAEREVQPQVATQSTPICGGREGQPAVLMTSRI